MSSDVPYAERVGFKGIVVQNDLRIKKISEPKI